MGCATWEEGPHVHGRGACRVEASIMLGGQVGSKASNSQFRPPAPIFIFYMAKPWEELDADGHMQWGEGWEVDRGS